MPNFFYLDQNNQKQGPVNEQQLQALAGCGIINPNSPLMTDGGHKGTAGQIPGLFATPPSPIAAENKGSMGGTMVATMNKTMSFFAAAVGFVLVLVLAGSVVWVLWWLGSVTNFFPTDNKATAILTAGEQEETTKPEVRETGKQNSVSDDQRAQQRTQELWRMQEAILAFANEMQKDITIDNDDKLIKAGASFAVDDLSGYPPGFRTAHQNFYDAMTAVAAGRGACRDLLKTTTDKAAHDAMVKEIRQRVQNFTNAHEKFQEEWVALSGGTAPKEQVKNNAPAPSATRPAATAPAPSATRPAATAPGTVRHSIVTIVYGHEVSKQYLGATGVYELYVNGTLIDSDVGRFGGLLQPMKVDLPMGEYELEARVKIQNASGAVVKQLRGRTRINTTAGNSFSITVK